MKALTITNPWAWAIVHLDVAHLPPGKFPKRIENRDWYHPYMEGKQFAIHTSKNTYDQLGAKWMDEQGYMTREAISQAPEYNIRGHIIGLARLVRHVHPSVEDPLLHDPWFMGPYGLVLRDVIRLTEPIPARGRTLWWDVDPKDVEAIRRQPRISVPNFD